ncbi:SDR family oxidoreductase [Martelella soudanensis]|uniref:SDR family oxidoreductase n=1 Tax=unclassified Martelella TaxID=2629616 RepID=UPI0015DE2121|nr:MULTISPECIES: SDR family oxidoreductase [unclassified Martelella]
MNNPKTADLRVIVTGGASGIGAATARLLVEGGAKVMIADLSDAAGEKLAGELGDNAIYQHLDVTSPEEWQDAVKRATDSFGGVNALFNNAGIAMFSSVIDATPEDFRKIMDINANGVFYGMHFTAPAIIAAGGGAIVNTSSTAGLQGYASLVGYVASKWAVRGMTKAAALDLARDNVRVCSIHPGPIATAMTASLDDAMVKAQPLPRFGEPEEVARLVRFLLTEATFSTGTEFIIDGGATVGAVEAVK